MSKLSTPSPYIRRSGYIRAAKLLILFVTALQYLLPLTKIYY